MNKLVTIILAGSFALFSIAQAEWNYGVGTGIFLLNAEGDQGFNVALGGIGPVTLDVDLDPEDFSDAAETALGLGGYATNGDWMFTGSFGVLKLEGDPSVTFGPQTVAAELNFDIFTAELTAGYTALADESLVVRIYGGARYISHDLSSKISASGPITGETSGGVDEAWVDALVGVTVDVVLAEKWSWNNRLEAGYGGSDGSYLAKTGISWMFAEHWSTSLYAQYYAVDFENGDEGDSDWYLYDVDEFGWGLNVMYHW